MFAGNAAATAAAIATAREITFYRTGTSTSLNVRQAVANFKFVVEAHRGDAELTPPLIGADVVLIVAV